MEIPHSIICLHSKYSANCKSFFDMAASVGINYIIPVCIDNKEIRDRVLSSQMNIQVVPCLLFVYGSGNIEKFEGDAAFNWVQEIINKRQYEEQQLKKQQEISIQTIRQKDKISEKELEEESEEESEEEIIPPSPKRKNKVARVSKKHDDIPEEVKEGKATNIDDLLDITEEDEKDFLASSPNLTQKVPIKENPLMAKVQEMQRMRDAEEAKMPKRPK